MSLVYISTEMNRECADVRLRSQSPDITDAVFLVDKFEKELPKHFQSDIEALYVSEPDMGYVCYVKIPKSEKEALSEDGIIQCVRRVNEALESLKVLPAKTEE